MGKQRRSTTYTVIAVIDDDGLWDTDTVTPSDGELTRILESWTSPKAGSFRQVLDSQQDTGAAFGIGVTVTFKVETWPVRPADGSAGAGGTPGLTEPS